MMNETIPDEEKYSIDIMFEGVPHMFTSFESLARWAKAKGVTIKVTAVENTVTSED